MNYIIFPKIMSVLRLWIRRSILTILLCSSYQSMLHSWIQLQARHITDIPIKLSYLRNVYTHYIDVIMNAMASQLTGVAIVFSTVYKGTDQRKHQTSASLAFVRGIHRWPVNSPYKGPVTRKMFPLDDIIIHKKWIPSQIHYRVGHLCLIRQVKNMTY